MANIFQLLPFLEGDEMLFVQGLTKDMSDNQLTLFANAYSSRRKDSLMILGTACAGFIGFAGIHRFILGHIGMGLLYLLTCGFCFIGTVIDLVNYRRLTFEYNQKVAYEISVMAKGVS